MSVIETQNLILRRWTEADAESYLALAGDVEVSDHAGGELIVGVEAAREFITDRLIPGDCYAITLRSDGCAVGNIALLDTFYARAFAAFTAREAAFSLKRALWGKGIMTEALGAVLDRAFSSLKLDYVCCGRFEDNERCENLLKQFGFVPCRKTRSRFVRSDGSVPVELMYLVTESAFRRSARGARV